MTFRNKRGEERSTGTRSPHFHLCVRGAHAYVCEEPHGKGHDKLQNCPKHPSSAPDEWREETARTRPFDPLDPSNLVIMEPGETQGLPRRLHATG